MNTSGETSQVRSSGGLTLKRTSPLITDTKQSSCMNYLFRAEAQLPVSPLGATSEHHYNTVHPRYNGQDLSEYNSEFLLDVEPLRRFCS
jgi:hypothetical protein